MPEPTYEASGPHFDLDDVDDDILRQELITFQQAVYSNPDAVVALLEKTGTDSQQEHPFMRGVGLATSREIGLGFDEATENAIRVSDSINQLQKRRRENAANDSVSQELAASLRKERLRLFVSKVIEYTASGETAEVLTLPSAPQPQAIPGTSHAGDKAS